MNKQCTKCLETKPADEFYRQHGDGLQRRCKACVKAATAAYARAHPEARRAYEAQYRASHPRPKKGPRQWVRPESKTCYACREVKPLGDFYAARTAAGAGVQGYCKPCAKALAKQVYAANPSRFIAKTIAWTRREPEKARALRVQRRARKRGAGGSFTATEWMAKKTDFGQRCAYCYAVKPLTQDHIVPLSRGGKHCGENIVPACRSCNSRKHTKSLLEFVGS